MEDRKKIAYLIAAHNDPAHLERLIRVLDDRADFFIHIDKKQSIAPFTKRINGPNVFFLANQDRIKVYWGGFSQVQATLNLLERCLDTNDRNPSPYKKVVFMSGADYPIKNNDYIHRFFDENKATNFIRGMNVTKADTKKYNYCIRNYLFFNFALYTPSLTRLVRKVLNVTVNWVKKKPNYISMHRGKHLDVFHGSSWWALNIDVIKYIRQYISDYPEIGNYFRYSLASDEKFFHTLFFNSVFANTNLYRGEEPYTPFTSAFANLHIIDQSLQKWFDLVDFDQLKNADQLFVRKVSSTRSKTLLDRIDRDLLGRQHRYET
ncbi:glycosyl transferase [Parapedobacter pyrenivorans]|uniref:Peptide O-xylosyltransferase n=1 Tax=Parapedobacter pyrenivorans TaxID=1305674 RepID=A0A917M7Y2_9SPHI|nr:beta-1,6-N-acetylglucosaminyltransferase [Parapedobacter pyrenivorans]GGG83100.1 glycosyl transferase [Parapedobacter pyrenivorans]